MTWVFVALAGAAGSACRYLLDHLLTAFVDGRMPWGTLVVNVSGSLGAGVVGGLAASHTLPSDLGWVLGAGFLGAYTTFSTAMFETLRLWEDGDRSAAAANALVPLVVGTGAAAFGWWLVT